MKKAWLPPLSLLLCCFSFAGCGNPSPDSTQGEVGRAPRREAVTVFGASSTINALGGLCEAFQRENGAKVVSNFAASSTLAQQIISGAEADLFLSANEKWADAVDGKGLVSRRVNLLRNRLVVIAPADSRLTLRTGADIRTAAIERLALGDPSAVPAGIYAKQYLVNLGLWEVLERKVVAGADVRQVLAYVEQGAAEAGIVFATDTAVSDRVKVLLEIPPEAHDPIIYALVLLKSAEGNAAAESLYSYLQSAEAAAVFEKYGFALCVKPAEAAP